MTFKLLTHVAGLLAFTMVATACSSASDDESAGAETNPVYRQIAGTSALGRAGSWSNNCLGNQCARANNSGNYLLSADVSQSALMSSVIPQDDGSTTTLYSRYRHDDNLTSAIININPSTHAILDVWSNYSQEQSIDMCADDTNCSSSLMSSFTPEVEAILIAQFDALLADAWPEGRDPFEDIYVAAQTDDLDRLDVMHDFISFVVTSDDLIVFDNDGTELTRTPLGRLTQPVEMTGLALTAEQYAKAKTADIDIPSEYQIDLSVTYSPTQPTTAPVTVTVDATGSSSVNGEELVIEHDLTLASGHSVEFDGEFITTTLNESGNHIWVVTATVTTAGDNIFSKSQGFVIQILAGEDDTPQFGGEGSCLTPPPLTANTQNICQETQNGSEYVACEPIQSPSITLISSPAPCAREIQNDGALFGLCTITDSEIRIFHYENPSRFNNIETFEEKQARLATQCEESFEGTWSNTP